MRPRRALKPSPQAFGRGGPVPPRPDSESASAPVSSVLLDYHENPPTRLDNTVRILSNGTSVRIEGWSRQAGWAPGNESDELGGGAVSVAAQDIVEALGQAHSGTGWSNQSYDLRVSARGSSGDSGEIEVSVGRSLYSLPAVAHLSRSRSGILLLDAYESVFSPSVGSTTGLHQPAEALDRAFLEVLRKTPLNIRRLKAQGLERVILSLLNQTSDVPIHLERVQGDSLWLAKAQGGGGRAAMLISVQTSATGEVGIDLVDRVNGIRDRTLVSKAVVLTQSQFSSDVERNYQGLSRRLELVDYERLSGLLADAGWITHSTDFLQLPVGARPPHTVFISYSWKHRDLAVWLYNRLHGWHYNCFLDSVDLKPGDVIVPSLKNALAGSDAVVLCCSTEALMSRWVQAEIEDCMKREHQTGQRILIPARVDDSAWDATGFADRLWVDFRHWSAEAASDALEKLREAVDGVIAQGAGQGRSDV